MTQHTLHFCAISGLGEVGRNAYIYGYNKTWIMVDCGVNFADESLPGIDVLLPDLSMLKHLPHPLSAIVITHGHEDHIGALPYLYPQMDHVPIFASPFAAKLIKLKCHEATVRSAPAMKRVKPMSPVKIGELTLQWIPVAHSMPECHMLAIDSPAGRVIHTGDWKIDAAPQVGSATQLKQLSQFAGDDLLAVVSDSTNAMVAGESGSEARVHKAIKHVTSKIGKRRIVLTCFASNVSRWLAAAAAAKATDRDIVLCGRSFENMAKAAGECGYLDHFPEPYPLDEARDLARGEAFILATGSQGEPQSALAKMAYQQHRHVKLEAGDVVIFSSRIIPGNEKAVQRVQNQLLKEGIELITVHENADIHVSGHPCQDELKQLYHILKPHTVIPMHGETAHVMAHQALCESLGIEHVPLLSNGQMLALSRKHKPKIIDEFDVRTMCMDGSVVRPLNSGAIKQRQKIVSDGAMTISVLISARGELQADPIIHWLGVLEAGDVEAMTEEAQEDIVAAIDDMPKAKRKDAAALIELIKATARSLTQRRVGKKPMVDVQLIDV